MLFLHLYSTKFHTTGVLQLSWNQRDEYAFISNMSYWPDARSRWLCVCQNYFFTHLWTKHELEWMNILSLRQRQSQSQSAHTQRKNKANTHPDISLNKLDQYRISLALRTPKKSSLGNSSCGTQLIIRSRQDNVLLPTWIANHFVYPISN